MGGTQSASRWPVPKALRRDAALIGDAGRVEETEAREYKDRCIMLAYGGNAPMCATVFSLWPDCVHLGNVRVYPRLELFRDH
jgi:hypothetical protein